MQQTSAVRSSIASREVLERNAPVRLGPHVDDLRPAQLLRVRDLPDGRELVLADDDPVSLARKVERGDERAHPLRHGRRNRDVVGLGVQETGERRARRLVSLDPELPLGSVLVPAREPLLRGSANAIRERSLRARVRVRRVLEDRELVPNGQARGQVPGHVPSGQGRPCGAPRAGSAPRPCPRARHGRWRGRTHGPRSTARCSRSARQRASRLPPRAPA